MNKFDKIIYEGMINTRSMLMARRKVLLKKQSVGYDVKEEIVRAKRFEQRFEAFVSDWQYWYYDTREDEASIRKPQDAPALPGIWDGVEVRIQQKLPGLVLPRAHEIELVIDNIVSKG